MIPETEVVQNEGDPMTNYLLAPGTLTSLEEGLKEAQLGLTDLNDLILEDLQIKSEDPMMGEMTMLTQDGPAYAPVVPVRSTEWNENTPRMLQENYSDMRGQSAPGGPPQVNYGGPPPPGGQMSY